MIFQSRFMKVTKLVTAEEYLQIVAKQRQNIKRTKFIPPKLGTNSFGKFLIEF